MLIIEDGSVVDSANSYQSVADVIAILARHGYSQFAALGTTTQEQYLIRATTQIDTGLRTCPFGVPYNVTQSLFFPRKWAREDIPFAVLLATALQAEYITVDQSANTGDFADLPAGVTEVELADSVRVRKQAIVLESPTVSKLKSELRGLIRCTIASLYEDGRLYVPEYPIYY